MKMVPVHEAAGSILCHDLTQIIPGIFKGPAFKKGHIVREEDIPRLLDMGKEHIYVWEMHSGLLHENDAAVRIARAAAGKGIGLSGPNEGKVDLVAEEGGLLVRLLDAGGVLLEDLARGHQDRNGPLGRPDRG